MSDIDFRLSTDQRIALGNNIIKFLDTDKGESAWIDPMDYPDDNAWFVSIPALYEYGWGQSLDPSMGTVALKTRRRARELTSMLIHSGIYAYIGTGFNHRHN